MAKAKKGIPAEPGQVLPQQTPKTAVGMMASTPFGRVPVIEDLGDKVTVEYADKSRKVFPKSEVTID